MSTIASRSAGSCAPWEALYPWSFNLTDDTVERRCLEHRRDHVRGREAGPGGAPADAG